MVLLLTTVAAIVVIFGVISLVAGVAAPNVVINAVVADIDRLLIVLLILVLR